MVSRAPLWIPPPLDAVHRLRRLLDGVHFPYTRLLDAKYAPNLTFSACNIHSPLPGTTVTK